MRDENEIESKPLEDEARRVRERWLNFEMMSVKSVRNICGNQTQGNFRTPSSGDKAGDESKSGKFE